jgi:hypothetical protein
MSLMRRYSLHRSRSDAIAPSMSPASPSPDAARLRSLRGSFDAHAADTAQRLSTSRHSSPGLSWSRYVYTKAVPPAFLWHVSKRSGAGLLRSTRRELVLDAGAIFSDFFSIELRMVVLLLEGVSPTALTY